MEFAASVWSPSVHTNDGARSSQGGDPGPAGWRARCRPGSPRRSDGSSSSCDSPDGSVVAIDDQCRRPHGLTRRCHCDPDLTEVEYETPFSTPGVADVAGRAPKAQGRCAALVRRAYQGIGAADLEFPLLPEDIADSGSLRLPMPRVSAGPIR